MVETFAKACVAMHGHANVGGMGLMGTDMSVLGCDE